VLSIRGSWSVSDIFTDLVSKPGEFDAPGFPENTYAHNGMIKCTEDIIKKLEDDNLLDKILQMHADYELVITGHSLGAALAILVGSKLRSKYRDLKVYAYATPAGMLSREASKYTEQFAFTIVVGDDCMARLSMEAVENLRTSMLESLQSCRLPKVTI
jgi:sn1-specific diacylglycerol lipase